MFKLPLDAWVVAVPTAYACLALTGLIVKTLVADPEMTTLKYYMETPEEEVAKTGQHFNDSVRDLFLDRIRRNRLGVFVNDIKVEPK